MVGVGPVEETGGLPMLVVGDDVGGPVRVGVVLAFVLVELWGCSPAPPGLVEESCWEGLTPTGECNRVSLVERDAPPEPRESNPASERSGRSPPPPTRVRGLAIAPDRYPAT